MKPERNLYLILTTNPLPLKKSEPGGGYRFWAIGKKSSFLLPIASCLLPSLAHAQPIIPATDGTGTVVTPDGNRFDIRGGQLSRDGANLFHSFQRFGLNTGQIANFLSPQAIRNILARVTGGEPSVINGLIQISGGSPNLFLMNPAGIVFGPNAQLNIPASFLATTSSGIGFGDNWFSAFGPNNYSQLVGTPNAFAFPNAESAAIVNAGNLAVAPGEHLTLLGGTVISIGTLEAPGGTITLVAVPGEKVVRLSQEGRLLSLDISPLTPDSGLLTPESRLFTPMSLPQMLTGGSLSQATGVTMNSEGQLVLTGGKAVNVTPGTAIVAGTVDAAVSGGSPSLQMGGTVEILGGRIFLSSPKVDVSGNHGGGTVEIAGLGGMDHAPWGMATLNIPSTNNSQSAASSEIYVSSESVIAADAKVSGDGGHVTVGRWGTGTVLDFHGQISARGGSELGNGGVVELSGGGSFAGSINLSATNGNLGTVKLNSENIVVSQELSGSSQSGTGGEALTIPQSTLENLTANADVALQANNDITINNGLNQSLSLKSGDRGVSGSITFTADADRSGVGSFSMLNPQNAILTAGGDLTISGQNITLGRINASGGAIKLTGSDINFQGGANSISSSGGSISIAPMAANQGIEIGGVGSGYRSLLSSPNSRLNLDNQNMAALSPGFKSVTIGRYDGTGAITVNAVRVDDPLTIQSPGGRITVAGEVVGVNQAAIALNAKETTLNANISTARGDINLNTAVTLGRNVSLSTSGGGNIAIAGAVNSEANQAHDLTLATGTGNIRLGGAVGTEVNGQLGNVLINNAGNVTASAPIVAGSVQQLAGTGKTTFNEVHTTAKAGVNLVTSGDIVTGNVISKGGEIQLTSKAGAIATGQLNSAPDSTPSGMSNSPSTTSAQSGGNITLSAASSVSTGAVISFGLQGGGDVTLNSGSGGITVTSINTGSLNGSGGNVTVNAAQSFHSSEVIKPSEKSGNVQGDFNDKGQPVSSGNTGIHTGGKTGNGAVTIRTGQTTGTQNQEARNDGKLFSDRSIVTPVTNASNLTHSTSLATAFNQVVQIEQARSQEFINSLGVKPINAEINNGKTIQETLKTIAQKTGKTPAAIYVISRPEQLELVLVTPEGPPVFKQIPAANREALQRQVQKLIGGVSRRPNSSNLNAYLSASQQLYQWMIAPLEDELQSRHIDTLAFSLDPGMRTLPLAALQDGKKFLVQKYSLGLIPSINLTDTSYQSIKNLSVLAMGAAEFHDPKVVPLPAVPLELSTITQDWHGRSFLNQEFTLENLRRQRNQGQFGIMHLATHGSFDPSTPSNSYIQLWDSKLRFDQLRELGSQRLELLVLSACETAFGSADAELGFAGLAVQSGVKSVLASLWQVDDAGTLGLMSEFYRQLSLQGVTVKAEALRKAQIAMIEGDLRVEGGQLRSTSRGTDTVALPNNETPGSVSLSHPYYWASFTMIGSPW